MRPYQFAVSKSLLRTFEKLKTKLVIMTIESNKIDIKAVKEVVGKLPIELVNPLLMACDFNRNFLPPDDATTDKKKLKIHREKLVDAIVEGNDVDIFNQAGELAKSLDIHDKKIDPKQKELEKLKAQIKEKREEIKNLDYIKQKDIDKKAQELVEALGEEKSQRLAQYYSDTDKARAELYREKEREKSLKAYSKGLAISVIDDLEDEYIEAAQEVNSSTVKYAEKVYSEIEKNLDFNPNTEKGMKRINVNLNEGAKLLVNKAVNKAKLGLEYKNNLVMSALSSRAVKSKPQTVSVGV